MGQSWVLHIFPTPLSGERYGSSSLLPVSAWQLIEALGPIVSVPYVVCHRYLLVCAMQLSDESDVYLVMSVAPQGAPNTAGLSTMSFSEVSG
jgi:hypothetical protein